MADGEPIQAYSPAPLIVNLDWLSALAGANSIRFALKEESRRWFPDCEPGAMPPLGPLYGQRVFVDIALAREFEVVFIAGTHRKRFGCDTRILRPRPSRRSAGLPKRPISDVAKPSGAR